MEAGSGRDHHPREFYRQGLEGCSGRSAQAGAAEGRHRDQGPQDSSGWFPRFQQSLCVRNHPNLVSSGNAKIQQIIIARAGPDQEKNDYTKPFMVNISPDTEPWKDLVSAAQKLIGDFRLEFESAPVRATAGRGQKALEKLGPDPNLETKLNECCFSTHVLMADRAVCDTEEKKNIVGGMVVFGVCKELGDLCSREGIHGHRGNDHCWIC